MGNSNSHTQEESVAYTIISYMPYKYRIKVLATLSKRWKYLTKQPAHWHFLCRCLADENCLFIAEDCLLLNVHTRADNEEDAMPVMVWIHGGALVTGSGSEYPGELLTSKGVVLVTINYRLGIFGFNAHELLSQGNLSGVSGNQGLDLDSQRVHSL